MKKQKKKMKFLQILNTSKRGGGAVHLCNLISGLDPKKYNMEIAVSPDGPYFEEFKKRGVKVHAVEMMQVRFQKQAIKKLVTLISELKPDCIHAHGTRAAFFVCRGYKKTSFPCPVIYTVHGLSYNRNANLFVRVFYRQVERFICSKVDKVIAVSGTDGAEMVKNEVVDKDKLSVIPNAIDLEKFLAIKPAAQKNRMPIGTIARLSEPKGIRYLLDAMAILKDVFDIKAELIIVGDGPLKAELMSHAEKLGISRLVEWEGSAENTLPYYEKFNTFVLSSLWEGLPFVLIEAMAAGLPVISTDTSGGMDAIRDEETGLLVPRGNAEQIALAVKELIEKPELVEKITRQARKEAKEKYALADFIAKTDKIYQKLLNRNWLFTSHLVPPEI